MNHIRTVFLLSPFASLVLALLPAGAEVPQGEEPLRVISALPQGGTLSSGQSQMIVVAFSRPMVPLRELPPDESSGPLLIEPAVRGKYRWLGTGTLAFIPAGMLPLATEFHARVPAGTKSLDGSALGNEYRWSFETPRPCLERTFPSDRAKWFDTEKRILLQFSQPLDPVLAKPYVLLEESSRPQPRSVPSSLRFPRGDEMKEVHWEFDSRYVLVVEPLEPLRKGTVYRLAFRAGLPGTAGPLGLVEDTSITFTTYNVFRFLDMFSRGNQQPDRDIKLIFSNPVKVGDLAAHIKFRPHVDLPVYYRDAAWETDEIELSLPLRADTTYTVKIDGALRDMFGSPLGSDVNFTFNTAPFKPSFSMVTGPGLLESYGERKVPVETRNTDAVRLRMAAIPLDGVVPLLKDESHLFGGRGTSRVSFSIDRQWPLHTKKNIRTRLPLAVDEVLKGRTNGFVFIQINTLEPKDEQRTYFNSFLQVTALGITAKFSPENCLVWVTHLRDASPAAQAAVELRDDANRVLWTGRTDPSGIAEAPGWGALGVSPASRWEQPRVWVFVKDGDDVAFTRTEEGTGIEPWRFGIDYNWNPRYHPLEGTVFTDRGLYRSGEEVHIKGIVRRRAADTWKIPQGLPVHLRVRDSRNELIVRDSLPLSDFGSFARDVRLKPTAHLGYYTVQLMVPKKGEDQEEEAWGEEGPVERGYEVFASGQFRVETFRPAELEVTARSLQTSYVPGDTFRGTVTATYLFGAPMRKEKVEWRIRTTPSTYTPPGHDGYFFGGDYWWEEEESGERSRLIASAATTLDEQGALTVLAQLPVGQITGTNSLMFEADVTSPSRRVSSGRVNVVLHAGEFYTGIRRSSTFLHVDDTLRYDVITVAPDGAVLPNQSLKVSLIKRQWNSVRKAGLEGRYTWVTEKIDTVLESRGLVTGENPVHGEYVPHHAGLYFVKATGKDTRGNVVETEVSFYASGSGYVAWERSDDDRIEVVADAKHYRPGDVAHVLVKSPYEKARALVTLERDGILKQWQTVLVGSAPEIPIPIAEEHLPNVFVSVVLLQGRLPVRQSPAETDDVGRPSFKIGYVHLPVDAGTQHLQVSVSAEREIYRPGDSVTVTLSLRDERGARPARGEAVVSVADAGVLNLIGYSLPDPFESFFGPRSLAVSTSETIAHLVEQRSYGEKGEDVGGGGGLALAGIPMRGDFRFTAYWNPSVVTDDSGMATVRFKLPDNLTQFRVMVVAVTRGSEFGAGATAFRVNKELLLQASLPRFARLGDSFEGGVVATNYTKEPGHVRLRAAANGAVALREEGIAEFDLEAGASKELRFKFFAEQVGSGEFKFQASMGNYSDGLTLDLPVELPHARESVALFESTSDSARQAVVVPEKVIPTLGGIEFTASSTALGGLAESVDYLFRYPYGCLEQRMSRVLPIVLGKEMVDAFKLETLRGRDARAVAQNELDDLAQFQTESGGFACWKGELHASPYVTAYALYVAGEAKQRRYVLDTAVVGGAIRYMKDFLRDKIDAGYPYSKQARLAAKALMVFALTLFHQPEPAYVEQLYQQRNSLPLFARALLLRTIHATTRRVGMESEIVRDFMNRLKVSSTSAHFEEPNPEGLDWVFSSNTRTTAIILQALVETGIRDQVLGKVVRWIMDERRVGRWRSTQENACVVAALSSYYRAFESETPNFRAQILLAGKQMLAEVFKGRSLRTAARTVGISSLPRGEELPIVIRKAGIGGGPGAGILYYGVRMNYYRRKSPVPADEGIAVLKFISRVENGGKGRNGSTAVAERVPAGSLLKVTLTVVVPQERNFIVVDDPLPAGFEPVNLSFQTESSELRHRLSSPNPWEEEGAYWWGGFNHVEQRDDRILLFADALFAGVYTYSYLVRASTYGAFSMPPTRVEQMYAPDVFGRTSEGKVIVQ